MIRPLRRRHPLMIALVGVIAIPLFVVTLAVRPAVPTQVVLPSALTEPPATGDTGHTVEIPTTPPLLVRERPPVNIEVVADGLLEGADLLLYWAPAEDTTVVNGFLLGSLRGGERQVFTLPDAATTDDGVLIVYSLAHGAGIAAADWPAMIGGEQ